MLSKNKECTLPKTWDTINSKIQTPFRELASYGSKIFPFPKHWNPEHESFPFKHSKGLFLRTLDPLEQISTVLNDPAVMLSDENIRLDAYSIQDDKGEHISVDIMSSPWALHTQKRIKSRDPHGIMLVIIPYSDGLDVTHCINTSFTPVVVTLGNYSNSYFMTNQSKLILGYLPDINETIALNYLKNVLSMAETVAKREVSYLKLRVQRAFWISALSSIRTAGESGVLMPILGLGTRRIYPVIPFSIGDEPAQKSHLTMYNSPSCLMACTLCTIPTGDGFKLYDDTLHLKRNTENIRLAASLAEKYIRSKQKTEKLPSSFKEAAQYCQENSIHSIRNPFHEINMGELGNSIYDSPPCFLHTFIGGPVTYAVYWTLIIVAELQVTSRNFRRAVSQADDFIRSFKMNVKWPHLPDQRFAKGLFYLVESMTFKDKEGISYRKGGFRTSDAVAMNMQLLLALVSALPNDKNYEPVANNERFSVSNQGIFKIIITALYRTLHAYFSLRKTDWLLVTDVTRLDEELKQLTSSLLELYQLKQTSIKSIKQQFNSSKLHRICHYAYYISRFGPPCRFDTASLETNNIVVKGFFRQTSRRKSSSNLEMTCKISETMVTNFLQTIYSCLSESSSSTSGCKESTRVANDDDEDDVCFIVSKNQKKHFITAEGRIYSSRELQNKFGVNENTWRLLHMLEFTLDSTFFLVDYIKISAPLSTKMNEMILHGNYAAGINDFIEIQTNDDESDIAQIVSILCEERKGEDDLVINVLVKYLDKVAAPPSKFKLMPSVALYESTNRLSLIACEMIKRPAFIVKITNLKKSEHLFLQFPWEFFDRTGWCDTSEKKGALHPLPDVLPLPSIILSTEPALTFPQDPCEEIPIRKKPKPKWNYLDPPSGMRILKQYQCKLDSEFTDEGAKKRFKICRICMEESSKDLYFEYFDSKRFQSRPADDKYIEHTKCSILIRADWATWETKTAIKSQTQLEAQTTRSVSERDKVIHLGLSQAHSNETVDRMSRGGSSSSDGDISYMSRTQYVSNLKAESPINSYEELRRGNIARNERFLKELNLTSSSIVASGRNLKVDSEVVRKTRTRK